MRILKFLGVFLGTLILVLLIVFGFSHKALFTLFKNTKGIKEGRKWANQTRTVTNLPNYIGKQPGRVSISSLSVQHPDSSIQYNVHTPRTMGRLSDLFVVIAYVREVQNGNINPDEQVPLKKVNAYQLPFMYNGNHEGALSHLRQKEQISDHKTVALRKLVHVSVIFNDIAIADYLLHKIGRTNVLKLMDQLKLNETESPLPLSGIYITLNPLVTHQNPDTFLDSLSRLSRRQFKGLVLKNERRYINDPGYHQKVKDAFENGQGWDLTFTKQRDALAFFPKTTAADMGGVMKKLQQNKLISPAVSKKVKKILSWPMKYGQHKKYFSFYGGLYDNRMGMAAAVNFGTAKGGSEAFGQAIFFDNLQIAVWMHISNNLMHQDFSQRIIWDAKLRRKTRRAIRKNQSRDQTAAHE